MSREEKRAILQKMLSSGETIEEIRAKIRLAEEELARIPDTGVQSALQNAIAPIELTVLELGKTLETIAPLTRVLPPLAGYPQPKTYLFFLANNTELRPSAGFFGSYGILRVADGELLSLVTEDIYKLDLPAADKVTRPAPKPIERYLGVPKWFLRDANWSPDFSVAAQTAMRLYQEEAEAIGRPVERLDGVIAVTPDLAIDLLRIVGPVTVEGVTFTPENLVRELEYQVEFGFIKAKVDPLERKRILGKLVQAVVGRLGALPARRWSEVLRSVEKGLRGKQVLFYEIEPDLQTLFEEYGWAGRIKAGEKDALMVVDSNMAALKTDAVMERSIGYAIEPVRDGSLVATARVTYKNTGSFTSFTTRYRTYTRFYVPEGSELIRAEGHLLDDKLKNPRGLSGEVDVGSDLGQTVFGMFTSIEPGEKRTLSVTYRLPQRIIEGVKRGRYELHFTKQSGAKSYPLTLDLVFGKKLTSAHPAEIPSEWYDDRYRLETEASEDKLFRVGL